jgi:hypothetical protein
MRLRNAEHARSVPPVGGRLALGVTEEGPFIVILAVLPHVAGEARGGLNRVDANFAIDARALIQSIEYNRG